MPRLLWVLLAALLIAGAAEATTYTNSSTGQQSPGYVPESTPGSAYSSTNPLPTIITPSSATANGIAPVVSATAESSHVLKASAGALYGVYATNLTATAGFLVVANATSAPVDGAIAPLACVPLPANGSASINYNPGPAAVYSTGITAVVTSATTCFTKTTGVITAFISGSVQ